MGTEGVTEHLFRGFEIGGSFDILLFDPDTLRDIVQNVFSELFVRECSATRYLVREVA